MIHRIAICADVRIRADGGRFELFQEAPSTLNHQSPVNYRHTTTTAVA